MALQMTWQPSLLHHKRKNGPPLGLKNIGNSCYLNSVLQCLTYTPPLANFCLKFLHSSSCDSGEQERKWECPFCILEKRIARSLKVDLTLDTPSKMNNCLRVFADHFRCGRQEDAHEFLRYVIDACHNTCLRLKKLQQQRRKGGANEGFNGSTVVMEIFGGALQSQVKCLSCGAESNKVDEIMDINLDVSHSSSLKESLQKFFQAEVLDGNNKYKCENCKKLVSARKQMSLLQAPNVLVIQLKRFEGMYGGKIDKAIAFEEVLVLSSYMCKANQDPHPEYNLFGTIVHSGFSPDSGHYYAYIKDAMGRWYCCNDSYIKLSNLQEVLSEKVYILFFSRTKQRPVPTNTALASNGVKSQECNGSDASKSQKVAHSTKAVSTKQTVDHSFVRDNLTRSKVNKALSGPQDNLSGFGNSATKKFPATVNGKIVNKSQSNGKSGDLKPSISMEKGEKNMSSVNGNGVTKSKTVEAIDGESSHAFPSANGNGKSQSAPVKSVEAGMPENSHGRNGLTTERGANRHELQNGVHCPSKISGSKRKSLDGDSCILFAKDIHSQEKLKEFKEVFNKREEDFPSLTEYNDYLEEVEDMIFNLVEGIDVPAIEEKIAEYEKENAEQIMNAQARKAEEYAAALAASKGQPAQADSDMSMSQSSQVGVAAGAYAPAVAGGGIAQPRPTGVAPLPIPIGSNHDMQGYDIDDEEMMKLRAERGIRAGGWSVELSRKRALEEAFSSIWI